MQARSATKQTEPADQAFRRRFVFLLFGLQLLLALVVAAGVLQYVRMQRDNVLHERLSHAIRTVQGVEEHLTQTLRLVGLTLANLNLEEHSGYRASRPPRETQERLLRLQHQMPMLRSLSLADRQGRIVASSVPANIGHQIDLDELLPRAPVERAGLLRQGVPWEGRDFSDGRRTLPAQPANPRNAVFFPLALTLPGESGLVALAAVNIDYFLNRLAGNFDSSLLNVSVFDYEGTLLLSNVNDLAPGSNFIDPSLLARIRHDEIGQHGDVEIEHHRAVVSFRASRDYPLFVFGHAYHDPILTQWREDTLATFIITGLALFATLLITSLLTLRLLATLTRETRLHEAQRLAARVFESSNDGIVITAADTSILSVNPAFERISGYSATEVIGQFPRLLASGLHSPEYYLAMRQSLRMTGEWRGETTNRRKDGSLITGWLTITSTHDTQGNISGYVALFIDLSELRRSEELVRRLSTALEQSPSSILITNLEAEIEYVNPQFERATGYRAREAIGQNPRILKSQLTTPETFRALWERLLSGEHWEGEFINRRKDGTIYYDYVKISPIRDGDGRITHYIGIQHDISARKAAEIALIEAKSAAEAANRAKSTFIANMSHELRTPMHGLMGMLTLAKHRMTDPKGIDHLDIAKLSAERLLDVLNDILDISRLEIERMVLDFQPFQLADAVANTLSELGEKARAKGICLRDEVPAELLHLPLEGDLIRLNQILLNLVGNAIKFTDQGEVVLRIGQASDVSESVQVRFEIADSGIGIGADAQSRLFQVFEQADNSMTRRFGGTGLGLAISKRLVNLMGGRIGFESTPGSGSLFWFEIPLKKRTQQPSPPEAEGATATVGH